MKLYWPLIIVLSQEAAKIKQEITILKNGLILMMECRLQFGNITVHSIGTDNMELNTPKKDQRLKI